MVREDFVGTVAPVAIDQKSEMYSNRISRSLVGGGKMTKRSPYTRKRVRGPVFARLLDFSHCHCCGVWGPMICQFCDLSQSVRSINRS